MAKDLVIVESPAKAKTINKFLGKGFVVMASVGHIKDLPKSKLGVDVENDFAPEYVTIKGKGQVIKDLKKTAKGASKIYLAPDPDREGEAIAYHIARELDKKGEKTHRVLFNEITEKAIREAIAHPLEIDVHKYEAQQARRVLDRLVGYQVSPLLWDKVRRGLSAGRVQSVTVRLICDREREIRAFNPVEYWSITALLSTDGDEKNTFEAKLQKQGGKKIEVSTEEESGVVLKALKGAEYRAAKVDKKERKRNPTPPFITSRLQQEASRKLGFTAKKTMMVAQQLYEGVEIGKEGPVGLITYMRTDSTRIADEAVASVREYILGKFGNEYLPEKPVFYRSKKGAQEAHECIRPTYFNHTPESIEKALTRDQMRLYELIWNRFVSCQMAPARFDQTKVEVSGGDYTFGATGSVLKFPGFLAIYEEGKDTVEEKEGTLPVIEEGQVLDLKKMTPLQHFTSPPPRFSEATIVKELEENGIGRPSTYAAIISTIVDREYVEKEGKTLKPTELGFLVTDLLVGSFPDLLDVEFTAGLEGELDKVEDGSVDWVKMMKSFYGPFKRCLDTAKETMKNVKTEEVATDLKCDKCGSGMVIKWGRNGKFLACSGYPECKNTSDFKTNDDGTIEVVEKVEEYVGECEKCGKPMVAKSGRFGRFLACTGYPECKSTKPYTTGVKCGEEGCKGELVERRTKKGRTFFSCSKYPKCKFATWTLPKEGEKAVGKQTKDRSEG